MIALLRHYSWPEARHHPWRTAVALLAITLGVALAFSVQLINQSALGEFSSALRSIDGAPDFELRGQAGGFDEALYARVARHAGVAVASPIVEVETFAYDHNGQRVALRVLGIDALVAGSVAPALLPHVQAGADRFAALDPGAIFLNPQAGVRFPDTALRVQTPNGETTLRIAGFVTAAGPPLAVMDIAGAQASFGWLGRLSRIDVRLAPGTDRAALLRDLALPAGVRAAAPGEATERIANVSRAYRVNLTVLALVALFTGAFLVFSILSLSVAQRQPQLALLGVLGLGARERLGLVLAESALLGAVGSAFGLLLGTALAALALRVLGG
ncbi:MAG: ABC transporter permease, partial [Caldimonas sp.]